MICRNEEKLKATTVSYTHLDVYKRQVWCGEAVQDQILAVYNNDGPGFRTSLLGRPEHQRIANRIQTILPESSRCV